MLLDFWKRKRGERRIEREDRPLNTSDGRDLRELLLRYIEKREVEDVKMEEEKEKRSRRLLSLLKVPDSIETRLLD